MLQKVEVLASFDLVHYFCEPSKISLLDVLRTQFKRDVFLLKRD